MLTRMTDEDWATVLQVFRTCCSRRGAKGRNDRKFLEALHYFMKWRDRRPDTWEGGYMDDLEVALQALTTHQRVVTAYREWQTTHGAQRSVPRGVSAALAAELNEATRRIEADSARLQELEAAVETRREAHFEASESVHGAQSDLFAVSAEVTRLETELQHLGEARRRLEARLAQLELDREHWLARRETLGAEEARWQTLAEYAALRAQQAVAREVRLDLLDADREL